MEKESRKAKGKKIACNQKNFLTWFKQLPKSRWDTTSLGVQLSELEKVTHIFSKNQSKERSIPNINQHLSICPHIFHIYPYIFHIYLSIYFISNQVKTPRNICQFVQLICKSADAHMLPAIFCCKLVQHASRFALLIKTRDVIIHIFTWVFAIGFAWDSHRFSQ